MNWKKLLVSALMLAVSVCGIADAQAGTKRADKFKADVLYLCKEQASDPSNPATGTAGLYCKTDGRWYLIDDAGSVIKVGDASLIEDADGDTAVKVEESADEDIIRFDVLGSQAGRIDTTGWMLKGNDVSGDGPLHIGAGLAGSVTARTDGDELILEAADNAGVTLLSGTANRIWFGDAANGNNKALIEARPGTPSLGFGLNASVMFQIKTNEVVFNQPGGNQDTRMAGDTVNNVFFLDASQDNIGLATSSPDASALLDMVSTTKGLGLPSQTTAERDAISTPRDGLMVYDETTDKVSVRAGGAWANLATSGSSGLISCETVQTISGSTGSVDFTSLPANIRRLVVIWDQLSKDDSSDILVQIGDSGGVETSGYVSTSRRLGGGNTTSTAGFIYDAAGASEQATGIMTLVRITGDRWIQTNTFGLESSTPTVGHGHKTLSAELDRVTVTGTAGNLDAGSVNVCHEL